MKASIQEIQDKIVEEFSWLEEWDDKYAYIIEVGRKLAPLDPKYKVDANLIKGCQSQVWLHSYLNEDKVVYEADSDGSITKGLVSLLVQVLSEHSPDEIMNTELNFIDKIGMKQHLSPTRSNGLASMVKQMKMHALAYKAKLTK